MENRMKIGDFVKLTGSTLKTVRYYHKIGLLLKPERTTAGHRLYGPAELNRMRLIKHLKSLGLDLKRIKEILGDVNNNATLQEVLQSLRNELLNDKKNIEERITKIDKMLNQGTVHIEQDSFESPSFQMITEILGSDQMGKYAQTCPDLFDQHRKLYGILDDFQWGEDYHDAFRALAEFWNTHPEAYQIALDYGVRLAKVAQLPEDDPEIEVLALESAEFIKSIPQLKEIICKQTGPKKPLENLYNEMLAVVLPAAQIKFNQLFQQYLYL